MYKLFLAFRTVSNKSLIINLLLFINLKLNLTYNNFQLFDFITLIKLTIFESRFNWFKKNALRKKSLNTNQLV